MRSSVFVMLFCASALPLLADTVILKDGRRFENVRARLGEEEITIESEGRTYIFPVDALRELQYLPVTEERTRPRNVQPETPISELPSRPAEMRRPMRIEEMQNDLSSPINPAPGSTAVRPATPSVEPFSCAHPFLSGLIPFWSGHYCRGRIGTGVFFTSLETFAFFYFSRWLKHPVLLNHDPSYFLTGILLAQSASNSGDQAAVFLFWVGAGSRRAYRPLISGQLMDISQYGTYKRRAGLFFLSTLIADGLSALLLSNSGVAQRSTPVFAMLPFDPDGNSGAQIRFIWRW